MPKLTPSMSVTPMTRRIAKVVFSTLRKIGNSRGVSLKKIHDYIRDEYPNTPSNIVKLDNTLQKALSFGAVSKKQDRYALSGVLKCLAGPPGKRRTYSIIMARSHRRRRGRKGRRRSRRRRSRRRAL